MQKQQHVTEQVVTTTFASMDTNKDGYIDKQELKQALERLKLPATEKHVSLLFSRLDRNNDKLISQLEFEQYVHEQSEQLKHVFAQFDVNKDGFIDKREIESSLEKLNIKMTGDELHRLLSKGDNNKDEKIDFAEWKNMLLLVPHTKAEQLFEYWREAAVLDTSEEGSLLLPMEKKKTNPWISLVAGGVAGATSRTSVAPLERLKILYQVNKNKPPGIWNGLMHMYNEGGLKAYWRGNGVAVLKVAPESAIKWVSFESAKRLFAEDDKDLAAWQLFVCGALSGVAAHTGFFPLEVIKTRLSVNNAYKGVADVVSQIIAKEGKFLPFYKGLSASLLSTIPHSGVNLMAYSLAKNMIVEKMKHEEATVTDLMIAGSISSTLTQIMFYPMHLVKARLIMDHERAYGGIVDVFRKTVHNEGFLGLYKGWLPSFLKSVPAHCVTYVTFELLKKFMDVEKPNKHNKH